MQKGPIYGLYEKPHDFFPLFYDFVKTELIMEICMPKQLHFGF